eukprot:CAMPEP_0171090570 /NCGR_PEP_ID=MMETSP0766_2-20121228/31941_1 /TAXON_ID=439317 /ORGANISM="Gambierdiscus australes, Strain CAWD 149" /LENGTH=154 /DNA_ID=CAMNT_0011548579 /DNA_START=112 /DNA_END=576 /DNA_ORIENTATION=-
MGNNTCCSNKDTDKFETHDAPPRAVDDSQVNRDIPSAEIASQELVSTAASPPLAVTKPGEGKGGQEWKVVIDKTSGTRLGVDVDHQDGATLLIDAITGGLAQKWNVDNPDKEVKQGDRIIEVNGIRGDVELLVQECKKSKVLEMTVWRARVDTS